MFIYEKPQNKLNIEIDNHNQVSTKETPDVEIYKDEDKTTVLVDGKEIGSGGGGGSSQDALILYALEYEENSFKLYKDAAHEVPFTNEDALAVCFKNIKIFAHLGNVSPDMYYELTMVRVDVVDGNQYVVFQDSASRSYEPDNN